VVRAVQRLGMRAVAVYSDADAGAPHVDAADVALRIGPAPAARSYLDVEAIVRAARAGGADAIHPGYGFLSESTELAAACAAAGLVFVGPPVEAIEAMGAKDSARRLAQSLDVPVVPGLEGLAPDQLAARAPAEVGFPMMVKAAAGGGGKGMRIVRSDGELAAALAAAGREASAAFGNGELLVERLVEDARHVEVQVLADGHGAIVHLFERDCSVQRRHQKVIEEAPAPTVSATLRERLGELAVRLAGAVGYVGAGTVEFLVVGEECWFLEMNTRLQVEHPVTELVTGVDLVEWQLRVAGGEPLGMRQEDLALRGHAIEARVYAEDPAAGFLPQAGRATTVRWPGSVRVDAGLRSGQDVPADYDPLLAKLIASGPDRDTARLALVGAIDDTAVFGVTTNLGFLRRLLAGEPFERAEIDTGWLDRRGASLPREQDGLAAPAAAWIRAERLRAVSAGPFGVGDGWRSAGPPAPVAIELVHGGSRTRFQVDAGGVTGDGEGDTLLGMRTVVAGDPCWLIEIENQLETFHLEAHGTDLRVVHHGETYAFADPELSVDTSAANAGDGQVLAPMPGTVVDVLVKADQPVAAGDTLVLMEAMKMELSMTAPLDGVVTRVGVAAGDRVALGQLLVGVEPVADGAAA
jgi:3-methylcrotonyl-CoA carboxylase alpha subunit/acetyl-CoA/propionyl-CoA carboxylase biotin carboxyl carrier protein